MESSSEYADRSGRYLPPQAPGYGGPPEAYAPPEDPPAAAEPDQPKPWWKRGIGAVAALGFLIFKFGAKFKALALLLPKVKLFSTSASALVSVAAYALIFTWKFAIGFVVLLFIHEMGHVWQLRREGIEASAPMFVPFLGAFVAMKEMPKDAAAEARVGLAGPVLGAIACLVPVALWQATGEEFWQALAYVGFLLNLFNLLPVLPLDGGRAMAALSPWLWVVGFVMLIAAAFIFPGPILLIIVIFGGIETYRRFKARKSPESQRYNEVTPRTRLAVAAVYLGLVIALGAGMAATYLDRDLGDARSNGGQSVAAAVSASD